jgi:hypothetical protein
VQSKLVMRDSPGEAELNGCCVSFMADSLAGRRFRSWKRPSS